eukprot:5953463-Prymnesium_polylepis.1
MWCSYNDRISNVTTASEKVRASAQGQAPVRAQCPRALLHRHWPPRRRARRRHSQKQMVEASPSLRSVCPLLRFSRRKSASAPVVIHSISISSAAAVSRSSHSTHSAHE